MKKGSKKTKSVRKPSSAKTKELKSKITLASVDEQNSTIKVCSPVSSVVVDDTGIHISSASEIQLSTPILPSTDKAELLLVEAVSAVTDTHNKSSLQPKLTDGQKIWNEIKNTIINVYSIERPVCEFCEVINVEPTKCYVVYKSVAIPAALEVVFSNKYDLTRIDRFVTFQRKQ